MPRIPWWMGPWLVGTVASAEWLRGFAPVWVYVVWATLPLLVWSLRRGPWEREPLRWVVGLGGIALAAAMTWSQLRFRSIEQEWPRVRETMVSSASRSLEGELRAGLGAVERLATAATAASRLPQPEAFARLAGAVPDDGPELGVAILDSTGVPWAWGGRHRMRPLVSGDSLAARSNDYYVTLETRRHASSGRIVVATVLIWAHPMVPDRDRSLSELFRRKTGSELAIVHPGAATQNPDVFDYQMPTDQGPLLLFSVLPVPPEQGRAKELAAAKGSALVAWTLIAIIAVVGLAEGGATRLLLSGILLWCFSRAPLGAALGLGAVFSPATFFRSFLGPLSASAGILALTGTLAAVLGMVLWRRRIPRSRWSIGLGAFLLVGAPYLISELGRGITPPADGVSVGLWLTWQLTMVVSAAALIVIAAALFRGDGVPGPSWRVWLGALIAVAASIIGLLVWNTRLGWPDWYTFLWTPALFLVALPARRWATITGIAVVAGSSAALVTWGAELNGRMQVARGDVARLGPVSDPLAISLLDRLGDSLEALPVPGTPAELFALWTGSRVSREGYPVRLGVWSRGGIPLTGLPLDSLDLPVSLVGSLVRGLDSAKTREISRLDRVPGTHYLLLQRVGDHSVVTVALGPRSRLIVPGRLSVLLRRDPPRAPLYELSLSPPEPGTAVDSTRLRWRRDGWVLRGERRLSFPGGVRHVHGVIDMRGPVQLLVRGSLAVILDVALLATLWFLVEWFAGERPHGIAWRRLTRSYQVRLAVTLAGFFVLPVVGFAAWSLARLGTDARESRDLLITQALRDAVLSAGGLLDGPSDLLKDGLRDLGARLDAELALYSGGALVATSAPILEDLGLIEPLLDPAAFRFLALGDELETTRDAPVRLASLRVGYRVVQPGPPGGIGILASPRQGDDPSLAESQADLAMILMLATLVGLAGAVAGARLAARALSRPVADLRRSAIAIGQGQPSPATTPTGQPVEFEAVFGAFDRMALDIRTSQRALEESRRRTATVLATVATGVVALEPDGRVLLANPRAREMLRSGLRDGSLFREALGDAWHPLVHRVEEFLAGNDSSAEAELDLAEHRYRLQLTRLGADLSGVVLALNDLTEVTHAERVLAWGEMARQVAHEIKNPLTPLRLGVQHLQRAYRDRRGDFQSTLEETTRRILAEIDRLDTIARAFSRFAAPADEGGLVPLEPVDLRAVGAEVVQLYGLSGDGAAVSLSAPDAVIVPARTNEVKEVLGNLIENARNAGATRIAVELGANRLTVSDDGRGIARSLLPRIFEPKFSTTTSGSGLGLAIVRRLVRSWGAEIEVESEVGQGTRITVRWSS